MLHTAMLDIGIRSSPSTTFRACHSLEIRNNSAASQEAVKESRSKCSVYMPEGSGNQVDVLLESKSGPKTNFSANMTSGHSVQKTIKPLLQSNEWHE